MWTYGLPCIAGKPTLMPAGCQSMTGVYRGRWKWRTWNCRTWN